LVASVPNKISAVQRISAAKTIGLSFRPKCRFANASVKINVPAWSEGNALNGPSARAMKSIKGYVPRSAGRGEATGKTTKIAKLTLASRMKPITQRRSSSRVTMSHGIVGTRRKLDSYIHAQGYGRNPAQSSNQVIGSG